MAVTSLPFKTYAISYGFLEGRLQSAALRRQLQSKGLTETSIDDADVVIAHSAGVWHVPSETKAKLVLFIGAPLAQNRHRTLHRSNAMDVKHLTFGTTARVAYASTYYALTQPRRNWQIVRRAKKQQLIPTNSGQHILIANRHDPWHKTPLLDEYLTGHDWAFISLPGSHDNLWQHPEEYVAIITYYAQLLAKTRSR